MSLNSQFSVAVHVLAVLARYAPDYVKSGDVAASVNTNPVVVRRILGKLSKGNLIASLPGSTGGATIARPANKITLAQVYSSLAFNEVIQLPSKKANQDCPVGKGIETVLCRIQKDVDKAIDRELREVTLCDVMKKLKRNR